MGYPVDADNLLIVADKEPADTFNLLAEGKQGDEQQ